MLLFPNDPAMICVTRYVQGDTTVWVRRHLLLCRYARIGVMAREDNLLLAGGGSVYVPLHIVLLPLHLLAAEGASPVLSTDARCIKPPAPPAPLLVGETWPPRRIKHNKNGGNQATGGQEHEFPIYLIKPKRVYGLR